MSNLANRNDDLSNEELSALTNSGSSAASPTPRSTSGLTSPVVDQAAANTGAAATSDALSRAAKQVDDLSAALRDAVEKGVDARSTDVAKVILNAPGAFLNQVADKAAALEGGVDTSKFQFHF
jgi:small-conductance mechanosensitive channel